MLKDEELLPALRGPDEGQRSAAFKTIYYDPDLRHQAWGKMNDCHPATQAQFEEIWQETMLGLVVARNKFLGESSLTTFIVRIAINKWLTALKKLKSAQKRAFTTDQLPDQTDDELLEFGLADTEEEYAELLNYAIRQLGERCQGMVKDAATGRDSEYLTGEYEFSSKNMAKKELYNCRERLRKFVRSKPLLHEKLKDWLYRTNLH